MSEFNIKLSPVKQELSRILSNGAELKVAYAFYSTYTQSNKKISKIKEFVKFLNFSIQKYGKVAVLNSIHLLNEKFQSGTVSKSTVNLRYLEGIIKNNKTDDVLVSSVREKSCSVCGTLLVNNVCQVCGK